MDVLAIEKPTAATLPLVLDSPHSGSIYPDDFDYACDFDTLKSAEDHYVEDLFESAPAQGATFLHALFPRSYIDPNRRHDDIDPALFSGKWNGPFENRPSARSDAGIGLIRRLVKPGVPVYDRSLTQDEILHRIERYYHPYHNTLDELIREAHYNFGKVWHINCHSMPSSSAYPRQPVALRGNMAKPVDFVLGDRDGTCCSPSFTRSLRDFIKNMGYSVSINDPFKGVEILKRHAAPARGINSLQLEINKSLYMNENTGEKLPHYNRFKTDIEKLTRFIAAFTRDQLSDELAAD